MTACVAPRKIESIQAARGIAAVAVVACHANINAPVHDILALGRFGVQFFFLLSGFLMMHLYGQGFDPRRYAIARARRIYLPYLPVGILACLAYLWLGRDVDWLASLALLPGQTALVPAWTLQHEIAFYALFGALLWLRAPVAGCLAWAGLILLRAALPNAYSPLERVLLDPVNLCFVAGVLLAAYGRWPDFRSPRLLTLLGDASYSVYLVHLPVMGLVWRLGWGFVPLLVSGVVAGLIYHWLVERPLLGRRADGGHVLRHPSPGRSGHSANPVI